MTHTIAILLASLLVTLFVLDRVLGDGAGTLFVARELAGLIGWLAFWR